MNTFFAHYFGIEDNVFSKKRNNFMFFLMKLFFPQKIKKEIESILGLYRNLKVSQSTIYFQGNKSFLVQKKDIFFNVLSDLLSTFVSCYEHNYRKKMNPIMLNINYGCSCKKRGNYDKDLVSEILKKYEIFKEKFISFDFVKEKFETEEKFSNIPNETIEKIIFKNVFNPRIIAFIPARSFTLKEIIETNISSLDPHWDNYQDFLVFNKIANETIEENFFGVGFYSFSEEFILSPEEELLSISETFFVEKVLRSTKKELPKGIYKTNTKSPNNPNWNLCVGIESDGGLKILELGKEDFSDSDFFLTKFK